MTVADFVALALSLPDAVESAHFGTRDFRAGGRIFATLPTDSGANLKLLPDQQLMLMEMYSGVFRELPNAWGARGWTSVDLGLCDVDVMRAALFLAHANVVTPKSRKRKSQQ